MQTSNHTPQASQDVLRDGHPYEVNYDQAENVASVFCGWTDDGLARFVFPNGLGV